MIGALCNAMPKQLDDHWMTLLERTNIELLSSMRAQRDGQARV